MPSERGKFTTVQFPKEIHGQLRNHLQGTGISLSAWLANAALQVLEQEQETGTYKIRNVA